MKVYNERRGPRGPVTGHARDREGQENSQENHEQSADSPHKAMLSSHPVNDANPPNTPTSRSGKRWAMCRTWLVLAVLASTGCSDYFDHTGVVVGDDCIQATVDRKRPATGEENAYISGWVFGELNCPAPGGILIVRNPEQESVDGLLTRHHGNRQIRFRPVPPLQTATTYEAYLEVSNGFLSWSFSTSSLGLPIEADLAGVALAFPLSEGLLLDPAGLAGVLPPALSGLHPIVQFQNDPGQFNVPVRLGVQVLADTGGPQDLDQPTHELVASWSDPFFEIRLPRLEHAMGAWDLVVEEPVFEGVIASNPSDNGSVSLSGLWDTRSAEAFLGTGSGSLCVMAMNAGGQNCEACSDGEVACLPLLLAEVPTVNWLGMLQQVGE